MLGSVECARRVADRQQRLFRLDEPSLPPPGFDQLLLEQAGAIENVLDEWRGKY